MSKKNEKPVLKPGCPACEFKVDTCRTTTLGGCGAHGVEA